MPLADAFVTEATSRRRSRTSYLMAVRTSTATVTERPPPTLVSSRAQTGFTRLVTVSQDPVVEATARCSSRGDSPNTATTPFRVTVIAEPSIAPSRSDHREGSTGGLTFDTTISCSEVANRNAFRNC